MTKTRTYKPQLKAQVVLQVLTGAKSAAQICRDLQIYEEALAQIGHFIDDVYLTKRIHSALGYLTPAEFEAQWQKQPLASIL